jgi:hypothetical protein
MHVGIGQTKWSGLTGLTMCWRGEGNGIHIAIGLTKRSGQTGLTTWIKAWWKLNACRYRANQVIWANMANHVLKGWGKWNTYCHRANQAIWANRCQWQVTGVNERRKRNTYCHRANQAIWANRVNHVSMSEGNGIHIAIRLTKRSGLTGLTTCQWARETEYILPYG